MLGVEDRTCVGRDVVDDVGICDGHDKSVGAAVPVCAEAGFILIVKVGIFDGACVGMDVDTELVGVHVGIILVVGCIVNGTSERNVGRCVECSNSVGNKDGCGDGHASSPFVGVVGTLVIVGDEVGKKVV